ncbi:MAG: hypothetical protein ACFNKL_07385 [Treponema sp.]
MKDKKVIIEQQKNFIRNLKNKTSDFINSIDKSEIDYSKTIILSGSVSLEDFSLAEKEMGNMMEWSI